MRIIFLSPEHTLILDILAWVFFHLSIGFFCSQIPVSWFSPHKRLYRTYIWEKGGEIYQRIFRVRAWKDHLPSGGSLYPNNFSIKTLRSIRMEYLERWLRESCRSEFCHWVMILPGVLFFLWNSVEVAWGMVFYAILNNVFPIVLQRFNRPRMRRMLELVRKNSLKEQALTTTRGYEQEKAIINTYN